MLSIQDTRSAVNCSGNSRRDFLRIGTLGLGGLSLAHLLQARAAASSTSAPWVRDRSVVMVFLGGGASHIETFNPNMDGPEQSRSVTGQTSTTVPGLTFGGTFTNLARWADHSQIVRCFKHPIGNHEQAISHVLTGGSDSNGQAKEGHSIGSLFSRIRGAHHPRSGLPTYVLLSDPHKDPQYNREMNRVIVGSRPGSLGANFEPFSPTGKGPAIQNMSLRMSAERFSERIELLRGLDESKRAADSAEMTDWERRAFDVLTRGAGKAFDLDAEPKAVRERFDTGSFKTGKKTFEPSIIGKQFLLARRLVEAGVGFVTVQSAGWDMHADGNNPGIEKGIEMLGRPLDKALSAFLADLKDRGHLDRTLVIVTGDFGRTPKINKNGGRDHWPGLCTLAMFGGGVRGGRVIGRSTRDNGSPAGDPVGPGNLMATVMNFLFDIPALRNAREIPTAVSNLVSSHEPIGGPS